MTETCDGRTHSHAVDDDDRGFRPMRFDVDLVPRAFLPNDDELVTSYFVVMHGALH